MKRIFDKIYCWHKRNELMLLLIPSVIGVVLLLLCLIVGTIDRINIPLIAIDVIGGISGGVFTLAFLFNVTMHIYERNSDVKNIRG